MCSVLDNGIPEGVISKLDNISQIPALIKSHHAYTFDSVGSWFPPALALKAPLPPISPPPWVFTSSLQQSSPSSDGISHNEEQVSESVELASVRARAGDGFQKPLFEQLQKNMDDKQSLNDDKYKETFSGTRGLDDEVSERSERACLLEDEYTRDEVREMAAET